MAEERERGGEAEEGRGREGREREREREKERERATEDSLPTSQDDMASSVNERSISYINELVTPTSHEMFFVVWFFS